MLDVAENPETAFDTVRGEIAAFDPALADRPALIALNKTDLVSSDEANKLARKIRRQTGLEVFPISADKAEGLAPLVDAIARTLHQMDQRHVPAEL